MSRVYLTITTFLDKFVPLKLQPLWNHPTGPKTVYFWSPISKGGLVVAGIGDLTRPADKLSLPQSLSLAATGCIWARWSLVIIPKNVPLCWVNIFIAGTQLYQASRAFRYQSQLTTKDKLSTPVS